MSKIKNKICSQCGKVKAISQFYMNKNSKDGYDQYCKTCRMRYNKGLISAKTRKKCDFDCLNCPYPECYNLSAPIQPRETLMLRNALYDD